jgi:hypothetical protein
MEPFDWFALASGLTAIVSAIWAGVQGRAAKRQAAAAEKQTSLSAMQLQEMRKANELTEKHKAEEKDAKRLRLEVIAKAVQDKEGWWLEVAVENNSGVVANIQGVSAVFASGSKYSYVQPRGDLELTNNPLSDKHGLPGLLKPGSKCVFRFGSMEIQSFSGENVFGLANGFVPPDYENSLWRSLERVEVEANNQTFVAPEGDGAWRTRFTQGFRSKP